MTPFRVWAVATTAAIQKPTAEQFRVVLQFQGNCKQADGGKGNQADSRGGQKEVVVTVPLLLNLPKN
jgi:hypothetical protein